MTFSFYQPNFSDGWSPVENGDQPVISCNFETREFRALVAPYGVCILDGSNDCWTAPTSPSGYQWSYADGFAAWIGWAQNHADHSLPADAARDVYANTVAAVARVKYFDIPNRGGAFAFGELHPSVDETSAALLNTMALSGDWRRVGGRYDFAGSQVVLNPGFRRDPSGRRRLSVRKYSGECVIASMSWEKPVMSETESSGCACESSRTASATFDAEMLAPKTAAVSQPLIAKEYPIAVLNTVTGDRRVIAGIVFDDVAVSLNVNHDSDIQSIVGGVSGVRLDGNVLYGTVTVDSSFEFSGLAASVLNSGLAGFSVEMDDSQVEWMPAAMAAVRGINVGLLAPDDEVCVQSGRLRGVGVVQTPAFVETEAARVAAAAVLVDEAAEAEVAEVADVESAEVVADDIVVPSTDTDDIAAELAAVLIANAGSFPELEG